MIGLSGFISILPYHVAYDLTERGEALFCYAFFGSFFVARTKKVDEVKKGKNRKLYLRAVGERGL